MKDLHQVGCDFFLFLFFLLIFFGHEHWLEKASCHGYKAELKNGVSVAIPLTFSVVYLTRCTQSQAYDNVTHSPP